MGQKTVRFSDLSGQLIMHDDALARIVVHEHPELVMARSKSRHSPRRPTPWSRPPYG